MTDRIAVLTGSDRTRVSAWAVHPSPPRYLEALLGPVPTGEEARRRWVTAAAVIEDYRETHDVREPASALGAQPDTAEQRRERDRAVAFIRRMVAAIEAAAPEREPAGRDRPGPDLTR